MNERTSWRLVGASCAAFIAASSTATVHSAEQARIKKDGGSTSTPLIDDDDEKGLRRFQERLADYATLHFIVKLKIDSAAHRDMPLDFATAIVERRRDAKRGDILVKDVEPLLRRLILARLRGPEQLPSREALTEEQEPQSPPFPEVVVRVNARFPSGAVRSSVPTSILKALPPLPDCIRYGFVRGDLVLVDTVAETIVDYLTGVVPGGP
jgi:hypothetical protein